MEAVSSYSKWTHHSPRSRSDKRPRKTSDGKEKPLDLDRISALPNPLILRILSFLSTKHAARTSLLSRKWQCLWTSIPILDFDYSRDNLRNSKASSKNNLRSFVSGCVNRNLILNQSPKIEKLRVRIDYRTAFAPDVDVWLRFATRKNVEEVDLDFSSKVEEDDEDSDDEGEGEDEDEDGDEDEEEGDDEDYNRHSYVLPINMFMFGNNPSLVTLKLKDLEIDHGRVFNWKSLKVLSLSKMSTNDDFISKMLSGSPSLELLELLGCWNYEILDIKSERLRKLVIDQTDLGGPLEPVPLKITAPYLQSLDISGYLYAFSVIDSSSLVDAKLDFRMPSGGSLDLSGNENKYTKILVELLGSLCHVKDLTVGSWCLQVLSVLEEKSLPYPLSSSVCLTVDTSLDKTELPGIARLLAHTPLLESLVINVTLDSLDSVPLETEFLKSYDLGEENYWSSQKSSFTLALLHLKTVRIVDFVSTKSEVELLLFLLKNASNLEKMTIHARNTMSVSLKKSLEVAQRLLSFPRCSRDAVVLFS